VEKPAWGVGGKSETKSVTRLGAFLLGCRERGRDNSSRSNAKRRRGKKGEGKGWRGAGDLVSKLGGYTRVGGGGGGGGGAGGGVKTGQMQ